jgi:hypothetical protein
MSERSTGPARSEPVEQPQAAEPDGADRAFDESRPTGRTAASGESPPIEVGDGPFRLTESDDDRGDDSGDERARPSRTKVIVLSALLIAGLAGAAVIGTTVWRISSQKDAALIAPTEVGTLRADDSDSGLQTADYLTTALAAEVDLDKTVGAVYTDGGASDRGVLFFGGTTLIWTPESDLDTAFDLMADDQGAVTGLHEVEAGPLGGTMKCGTTASDDGTIAVCGWADHGSLALAMFPNRTEADSAKLLLEIRSAAQTRQ